MLIDLNSLECKKSRPYKYENERHTQRQEHHLKNYCQSVAHPAKNSGKSPFGLAALEAMADAHQVTPGSPESGTPGKLPAPKDKRCKFCQAPFTSSSLGRHLDLYIKGKNPKPPDGLHNVDEIRRMRGNVTRRQARTSTSSTKREGSTSSSKPTPLRDERSPSIIRYYTDGERPEKGSVMMRLNEANWQVTGVINNLPPPSSAEVAPRYMKRRDSSRRMSLKNDLGSRHDALEERDRGRAAELALKEVLGSIRAAKYAFSSFPDFQSGR